MPAPTFINWLTSGMSAAPEPLALLILGAMFIGLSARVRSGRDRLKNATSRPSRRPGLLAPRLGQSAR